MAEIIDARVKQKTGVAADFAGYNLLEGEIALVRTSASGPVWNFKVGPGNFDELDWSLAMSGAAQEADTSTVFPTGVPGVYIPTENGTYNGITVDLSAGYTQLIWDGNNLVKTIFPISFDPSKDSLLYPNDQGFNSGYLVNGKVFISPASEKWSGYLPVTPGNTIYFDNMPEYTRCHFFDSEKEYISNVQFFDGDIEGSSIPSNSRFIGIDLYQGSNPDRSGDALIYIKDTVFDAVSVPVMRNEVDVKRNDLDTMEARHGIKEIHSSQIVYSGGFINGNNGYAQLGGVGANRSKTRFYDIRQVNKIIISGFNPSLPDSRWFYDKNLTPLGKLEGVNGIFDFKDFPAGAVYFAFTCEMETIKLSGSESIKFVYNGDTEDIEYYKRETYEVWNGSQSIDGQQLNGSGNVINNPNSSWSGYVEMPENTNLEIEGINLGQNTKAFYDIDFNVLGTISIQNGTIEVARIPSGAKYIGFNTRTTATGDSRPTARLFYVYDSLSQGGQTGFDHGLTIPSVIPVAVGIQANIYKDNIRPNPINDKTELFFNEGAEKTGTASNPYVWKTRELERSIQYLPGLAETVNMFARLRDRYYNILDQRNFSFVGVPADAGTGLRKTIILAGDSQIDTTFDGGKSSFAPFMKDLFDQSATVDMVFVGQEQFSATIYGETAPENRTISCPTEGYGSTTLRGLIGLEGFAGNTNPFLDGNGDFDLPGYWAGVTAPGNPYGLLETDTLDYFLTPSGTNDWSIHGRSPQEVVADMVTLHNLIQTQMPGTILIVGMPTLGSKLWSMDVRRKWSIDYYEALINEFEKPEYAGTAYLAAAGLWTDNLFASRQLRKIVEPYQRIVDTKTLLYNKAIQGGATPVEAEELVNDTYNLTVEERVFEHWDEYPGTNDTTHSGYVGAMQQADCYYSVVKYILDTNP